MSEFYNVMVGDVPFEVPHRYIELTKIGFGAQGVVVSARDTVANKDVAIKKLQPFQNVTHAKRAYREIKLMKLFNHPNIIGLLDLFTPQPLSKMTSIYICMEKMDASLVEVINLHLDHERISYLIYQLLCGVKHLQSAGILHRDLKPSNIVVDRRCILKILDFGLARSQDNQKNMTPYVVTRYYRSPEVILGMLYGLNVDIWSVGCIMAEMIRKDVLFKGKCHLTQWEEIAKKLGSPSKEFTDRLRPAVREFVLSKGHYEGVPFASLFSDNHFPQNSQEYEVLNSTNARDLLSKMLVIDPQYRITVDDALKHPYINLWYREDEVNGPAPTPCDFSGTEDLPLEAWKKLIYDEVVNYKTEI